MPYNKNYSQNDTDSSPTFTNSSQPKQYQNRASCSELNQKLYNPIMTQVDSIRIEEIIRRCDRAGLVFDRSNFSENFEMICVRSDWQSAAYEVRYGCISGLLKVVTVDMNSNQLCNNFLNSGSFGEILKFHVSSTERYALKNIKYNRNNPKQVETALQQVFFAKIFSALEIGPKFSQIFSYDAIIYRNNIQFAMEMCRNDYQQKQIAHEIKKKNLLPLLKTMHSLGICHMDIKYDNIVWSPTYRKFVFLDFTFTRFVKEEIGNKTMTKFFGTYQYCSAEMKKRFQLRDRSFVDLYYNDLYGLQCTWKQMSQTSKSTPPQNLSPQKSNLQQNLLLMKKNRNEVSSVQMARNSALARYFKSKMNIFDGNFSDVDAIFREETSIGYCDDLVTVQF